MLIDILHEKQWNYKLPLYEKYFEYVEYIKENTVQPRISIIVISWRLHRDTLESFRILQQQRSEQNFELIFIDNGGKEDEFLELKPFVDIYIRLNQNTGAYLARNIGAVFATAPILLFLEDDGIPDVDFVSSHLAIFDNYDVVSVRGVYLCKTDNPLNERQNVYYWGQKSFPAFVSLEGNASYLARSFFEVGGWDDQIRYGHGGLELALRLLEKDPDKRKHMYSPIPVIYHDLVKDEQQFFSKRQKHIEAFKYLLEKHPTVNKQIEEWQGMFLDEEKLYLKENAERSALSHLQQRVIERNKKQIDRMNHLFIPSYDPQRIRDTFESIMDSRRCLIFGAGSLGTNILNILKKNDIEPVLFLDNDPQKWGGLLQGLEIKGPNDITEDDFIVIASIYSYEITEQLQKKGLVKNQDFIIIK